MAPSELHIDVLPFPILGRHLNELNARTINLSEKELLRLGLDSADPDSYGPYIFERKLSIGGYLEKRSFYRRSVHFSHRTMDRNIHLGVDIWAEPGTVIYAPIQGLVHSVHDNRGFADYGPTVILSHEVNDQSFYSLYGHLSRASLDKLTVGQAIAEGECIGDIGGRKENGDWPPHLHAQLIRDMEENRHDYPGVCSEKDLAWYRLNCPDPMMILR